MTLVELLPLLVVFLPHTAVATGRTLPALALAPLTFGAAAALSAVLNVAFGVPLLGAFAGWWFASLVVIVLLASRRQGQRLVRLTATNQRGVDVALALMATVLALYASRSTWVNWDAHSIWFFHARWFQGSDTLYRELVGNGSVGFSHPDYPPLVPSTVGILWRSRDTIDVRQAQLTGLLLNVSATIALAWVTRDTISSVVSRWKSATNSRWGQAYRALPILAGMVIVLSAFGLGPQYVSNGTSDLLWSTSGAAALVLMLRTRREPDLLSAALLLALVASLTKIEALLPMLVLLGVGLLLVDHQKLIRRVAITSVGVPAVLWQLLVNRNGAVPGSDVTGLVGGLLTLRQVSWVRLWHALGIFSDQMVPYLVVVVLVSVLVFWLSRDRLAAVDQGQFLIAVVIAFLSVLTAALGVAGSESPDSFFAPHADRLTFFAHLVLLGALLQLASVVLLSEVPADMPQSPLADEPPTDEVQSAGADEPGPE